MNLKAKKMSDFNILTNELNLFLHIYEYKSINTTAQKTGMDAGNISRSLSRLEQKLSAPLFIRHQTGLKETTFAKNLFQSLQFTKGVFAKQISELNELARKPIRIGFSPIIGFSYLNEDFLNILISNNFQIEFILENSLKLIELIKRREIDLALVSTEVKHPGLIVKTINSEGVALCSNSGRATRQIVVNSQMISYEKLLQSVEYDSKWIVDDYFVIAQMINQNAKLMALLPEGLLQKFSNLKAVKIFPNVGKISIMTWPNSDAVSVINQLTKVKRS